MSEPIDGAPVHREFEALVDLPEVERAAALERLRRERPELAERVAALLAADAAAGEFLERPAGEVERTLVSELFAADGAIAPGSVVGAWRLVAPIGRGGMGEVWSADRVDGEFEQRAAVKLLRKGLDTEEIVARFRRERQILARLSHPGIVRLLDGGATPDGRPWFALELVEGAPITEACEREHASLELRIERVIAACEAVEAAHRQLVVHRDLKPTNILVTGDGRLQLLDFGIAKLLERAPGDPAETQAEVRALTPAYAAPEQVLGEPVTTATDVYALGVVLYELTTGSLPHRRETHSAAALASAVDHETLERPSTRVERSLRLDRDERRRRARALRGDLDTILLTALARDPRRRYPSAAALAEDLRRYLGRRPIAARPDRWSYRSAKFVRRHRVGATAAALVALSLVGGLSAALWQAKRAAENARESAANARRAERTKDFLISLFQVADPTQSGGADVTARELLEQGARRLESELAAEPDLRADLLEAIARIEASLGLLEAAERSTELALALRPSSDPVARASAEATLGAIRIQQGDLDSAQKLLERSLAAMTAGGGEPLARARVQSDLGQVLFWRKQSAAAEQSERAVYETYRRELGEEHVETALHRRNLGVILDDLGRLDEAEEALRRSQEVLERNLGDDHPHLGQSYLSLAYLMAKRGRPDDAGALFERALDLRRRTLGDRHIQTGQTLQLFADFLVTHGRYVEAEAAGLEALAIFRAANPEHFEVGKCVNGLGIVAAKRGDHVLAERRYREALANFERSLGLRHPFYWWTQGSLSRALADQGRLAEAEALQRDVLRELEAISGVESADAQWGHELLAGTLRRGGRVAEAEAAAARARAIAGRLAG